MHLYLLSTVFSMTRANRFPSPSFVFGFNHFELFLSFVSQCILTQTLTLALLTWFFLMYCWTACKPLPRSVCMANGSRSWTHAWRGYREKVKGRIHPRTPASQLNCKPPAQHLRPFLIKEPGHLFGLLSLDMLFYSALKPGSCSLTSVLCTDRSCILQFPSRSGSRRLSLHVSTQTSPPLGNTP